MPSPCTDNLQNTNGSTKNTVERVPPFKGAVLRFCNSQKRHRHTCAQRFSARLPTHITFTKMAAFAPTKQAQAAAVGQRVGQVLPISVRSARCAFSCNAFLPAGEAKQMQRLARPARISRCAGLAGALLQQRSSTQSVSPRLVYLTKSASSSLFWGETLHPGHIAAQLS
jgi:hypothetical protein